MSSILLARDDFREGVLLRDNYKCIICGAPAQDAHHIMERRLFSDGGYYLDNGVSVCGECHVLCEQTIISCEELREKTGITTIMLPEHLYKDQKYDKWANPILTNGQRLKGELFNDASVQIALDKVLDLFTSRVKYPRTHHLPWSPGRTDDDRIMKSMAGFMGREVVVSEKCDGENTSVYNNYIHARSIEYEPHPSRDIIKSQLARIQHEIPDGWRLCGENCYALHSIRYNSLPAYFLLFSVWNDKNECLTWDDTVEWAELLDLKTVPVIFREVWTAGTEEKLRAYTFDETKMEGYVVRITDKFHYKDFRNVVGKYVRQGHIQSHGHWSKRQIEVNGVKK